MNGQILISGGAIALISLMVIVASIKRLPDLGMLGALVIIGWLVWQRPGGLEQLGFYPSDNWPCMILMSLLLGCLLSFFAIALLEPLIERLTGKPHDIRIMDPVRGNLSALLQLLALVWLLVAFLEEIVFRGFLMTEIAQLIGAGAAGLAFNVLFTSILFGVAHWYQGPSGVVSTAIVGALLGLIFVWAGFNIWPVVLIHGFVDTLALIIIYANLDTRIKHVIIKPNKQISVLNEQITDEL